ncbi:hypothetical protein Psefu_2292 [Pseudomonas fulva 12-X]|uniref:Uncharacterized protein n=1 Tax=Pseudomonas fulva (strain 12-X) TaxID=743720 RepID=F6AC77_PSEF1|nr:hypothetical protein Psefu_2292 [Pseudomonas fulva 12-X]PZW71424.1 hypothetical protein F471_00498 [Pseudomonas sp. URMO17WK12:I1]
MQTLAVTLSFLHRATVSPAECYLLSAIKETIR